MLVIKFWEQVANPLPQEKMRNGKMQFKSSEKLTSKYKTSRTPLTHDFICAYLRLSASYCRIYVIDYISCCTYQSRKDNAIDLRYLEKYFDGNFLFG